MGHPTFIRVTDVLGNIRSRGIWINPAYIAWAEDLDGGSGIVVHMSSGTSIHVAGSSGDALQGYLHGCTLPIGPSDEAHTSDAATPG